VRRGGNSGSFVVSGRRWLYSSPVRRNTRLTCKTVGGAGARLQTCRVIAPVRRGNPRLACKTAGGASTVLQTCRAKARSSAENLRLACDSGWPAVRSSSPRRRGLPVAGPSPEGDAPFAALPRQPPVGCVPLAPDRKHQVSCSGNSAGDGLQGASNAQGPRSWSGRRRFAGWSRIPAAQDRSRGQAPSEGSNGRPARG
jgi:hypothetical protein